MQAVKNATATHIGQCGNPIIKLNFIFDYIVEKLVISIGRNTKKFDMTSI